MGYDIDIVKKALTDFKSKFVPEILRKDNLEGIIAARNNYYDTLTFNKKLNEEIECISCVGAGIISGVIGGGISGYTLASWAYTVALSNTIKADVAAAPLIAFLAFILGGGVGGLVIGVLSNYFIDRKRTEKKKNKRRKEELKEVPELRYKGVVAPSDIILFEMGVMHNFSPFIIEQFSDILPFEMHVDNKNAYHPKYFIGYVNAVNSDGVKVITEYTKKWEKESQRIVKNILLPFEKIVCILEPPNNYKPLNVEEVKRLELNSPLVCKEDNYIKFGFLGEKTNEGINLFADYSSTLPAQTYSYDDIKKGKVLPYVFRPLTEEKLEPVNGIEKLQK